MRGGVRGREVRELWNSFTQAGQGAEKKCPVTVAMTALGNHEPYGFLSLRLTTTARGRELGGQQAGASSDSAGVWGAGEMSGCCFFLFLYFELLWLASPFS